MIGTNTNNNGGEGPERSASSSSSSGSGDGRAATATTTPAAAPSSPTEPPLMFESHKAPTRSNHHQLPHPPSSFSSSFADLNLPVVSDNDNNVERDPFTPHPSFSAGDPTTTASASSSDHAPSTPFFFADAVLDLSEAHDIADTPEAPSHRAVLNVNSAALMGGSGQQLQPVPVQPLLLSGGGPDAAVGATTTIIDDDDHARAAASSGGCVTLLKAIPPAPFDGDGGGGGGGGGDVRSDRHHHPKPEDPQLPQASTTTASTSSPNAAEAGTATTTMHRLESNGAHYHHQSYRRPSSPPRWPRDVPWAMAFVLLVPTVLLGTIGTTSHHLQHHSTSPTSSNSHSIKVMEQVASSPSFHAVGWMALVGSALTSLMITHLLYGRGGSYDNESDRRHYVAHILTTYSPILHVATCLGIALLALSTTSSASARMVGVALPLYYCARDLFLFQRFVASTSITTAAGSPHRRRASTDYDVTSSNPSASSSSTSRQAFLQAMVETALDILSRSLNRGTRSPLGRAVMILVLVQFGVLVVWRTALLSCLQTGRVGLLLVVLVAGKWATGTCSRFLTYLASGGVASWFDDQHQLLQQLPGRNGIAAEDPSNGPARSRLDSGDDIDADPDRMPEAYRMVDASVYQSVLSLDDDVGLDDDDDDELSVDAAYETGGGSSRYRGNRGRDVSSSSNSTTPRVTVKSLLSTGISVSFGSIAQCGLLGGVAQYVYGQVRKYDAAHEFVTSRRHEYQLRRASPTSGQGRGGGTGIGGRSSGHRTASSSNNGFQSMTVESSNGIDRRRRSSRGAWCLVRCGQQLGLSILHLARTFVRHYSDLAMCHVAAYYKSYRHSARDVAALVEESGVESILEDDITTHVCSCAGGAIAGAFLVLASVVIGGTTKYDDWAVLANLLITFYLSYSLLFAVFEPLRAAIKAFYVSFAQHPESLSQAFPLIYHRLSRLAAESAMPTSQLPVSREYARASDMNDSSSADIQLV